MSGGRPNLVLLPGLMCDAGLWDLVGDELGPAAALSFGDLSRDDSIAAMAARVLDRAPARFALLGYSMGGYVAREVVHRAPERIERLALVNTSAKGSDADDLARRRRIVEALGGRPFTGLAMSSVKQAVHPGREADAELLERIQAMARRLGRDVFLRQMGLERADGHARLAEIDCPTLVVTSDADRLRSLEESQRLADGIPGARLEVIADCGHMTPLEKPAALAKLLIEWL
ncbi:MAG: alpha/beta fold hydrolase [Magnetovibrio sp.]|nr:alpha/beta fold hydrolase [Magnetovibrio sp.]